MDLVSYDGGDAEDEGVYGLIWDKVSHGGGLFVNIQFQVQGPRLFWESGSSAVPRYT